MFRIKPYQLFIITLFTLSSVVQASEPEAAIPEFCKENFPAINIAPLKRRLSSVNPDQLCTLESHQGDQVPVQVRDLLQSYTDIQRNQNERAVATFQSKMRKKVAQGIAESRRPYEGLYNIMSCERTRAKFFGGFETYIDSDCSEEQNFTPICSDSGINDVLNTEEQTYYRQKEQHVDALLGEAAQLAGVPITHPEAQSDSIKNEARQELKRAKKFSFLKRNIETALMAKALLAEKKVISDGEIAELERHPAPITRRGGGCSSTLRNNPACIKRAEITQKYKKLEEERQFSMARMYEEYPTAFKMENNWGVFDWFNYELSPSEFADELNKELAQSHPQLRNMNRPEHVKNFLESEDGKKLLNDFTKKLVDQPNPVIEQKGREATFAELRKKRETIEHICDSDGSDLHHFTGLAHEVMAESAGNSRDFVKDQSAYCYLVQTSPLDEGGFSTGTLLGAGALVVGGVALQFIPGIGNAAGAMLLVKAGAVAAGVAGGAIFSADAVDRYQASARQDENTQSIYHSANSWVSAEDLMASKDNRYTQAAFAAGEVALTVVDAAFIVRPAISLATRLYTRVPRTAASSTPAVLQADEAVSGVARNRVPEITTEAPNLGNPSPNLIESSNPRLSLPAPALDDAAEEIVERTSPQLALPAPAVDDVADVIVDLPRLPAAIVDDAAESSIRLVPSPLNINQAINPNIFMEFSRLSAAEKAAKANATISKIRSTRNIGTIEDYMMAFMQRADLNFSSMTKAESDLAIGILDAGSISKSKELLQNYQRSQGVKSSPELAQKIENFIEEIYSPMSTDLMVPGRELVVAGGQNLDRLNPPPSLLRLPAPADEIIEVGSDVATNAPRLGLNAVDEVAPVGASGPPRRSRLNRRRVVAAAAGAAVVASIPGSSPTDEGDADQTQDTTEDTTDQQVEITIQFNSGDPRTLDIEVGAKDVSFEVEAKTASGELPADGKWEVSCNSSGASDLCEPRSGYTKDAPAQSVKLFQRERYDLVFNYVTADPKFKSASFTVPLERVCSNAEDGPGVDKCAEMDRSDRDPSSTGAEAEEEPFWWEGLEPNQPPPPFVPGPPLRLRSFMLPGYI